MRQDLVSNLIDVTVWITIALKLLWNCSEHFGIDLLTQVVRANRLKTKASNAIPAKRTIRRRWMITTCGGRNNNSNNTRPNNRSNSRWRHWPSLWRWVECNSYSAQMLLPIVSKSLELPSSCPRVALSTYLKPLWIIVQKGSRKRPHISALKGLWNCSGVALNNCRWTPIILKGFPTEIVQLEPLWTCPELALSSDLTRSNNWKHKWAIDYLPLQLIFGCFNSIKHLTGLLEA